MLLDPEARTRAGLSISQLQQVILQILQCRHGEFLLPQLCHVNLLLDTFPTLAMLNVISWALLKACRQSLA